MKNKAPFEWSGNVQNKDIHFNSGKKIFVKLLGGGEKDCEHYILKVFSLSISGIERERGREIEKMMLVFMFQIKTIMVASCPTKLSKTFS